MVAYTFFFQFIAGPTSLTRPWGRRKRRHPHLSSLPQKIISKKIFWGVHRQQVRLAREDGANGDTRTWQVSPTKLFLRKFLGEFIANKFPLPVRMAQTATPTLDKSPLKNYF